MHIRLPQEPPMVALQCPKPKSPTHSQKGRPSRTRTPHPLPHAREQYRYGAPNTKANKKARTQTRKQQARHRTTSTRVVPRAQARAHATAAPVQLGGAARGPSTIAVRAHTSLAPKRNERSGAGLCRHLLLAASPPATYSGGCSHERSQQPAGVDAAGGGGTSVGTGCSYPQSWRVCAS